MNDRQQKIIIELQRVAALLGSETLAQREFSRHSELSISTIANTFGSWNRAVEAAGLMPITPTHLHGKTTISDDILLEELVRLATELGKTPTGSEMAALGHFSVKPYLNRWGKFSDAVKVAYAKYGVSFPIPESKPIPAKAETQSVTTLPENQSARRMTVNSGTVRKKTQYGEPIDFRGLRHAPVNEQGVVYMFGMVSRELGFLIESLRTAYPDCEGKRCVDEKRQLWENVLIEFEFRSSNFREHGHNPEACDLIVCWIHDWEDSPLEVLELRSAISYLSTL